MSTTDEALTDTFTHTVAAWIECADVLAAGEDGVLALSDAVPALSDAVLAALATLPRTVRVDPPVTLTITRHDDAGSRYTVTARYQRGRGQR